MNKIIIYTDGGARGNPGPAAIGIIIGDKKYSDYIGETTNNIAEYKAVIFALKKTKQLVGKEEAKKTELIINIDNELIYKQNRGEYKIEDEKLKPLFIDIWNLKQDFKKVEFNLIPREKNKEADKLVNEELNKKNSVLKLQI